MIKRKRLDTQKSRVYTAHWTLPTDVAGRTVQEVQAYVNKVTDYAWFRRRWGSRRVRVEFKRGLGGKNPAYSDTIVVGKNATGLGGSTPGAQRRTVLHEMAHVLAGPCDGNWHGPEFARVMFELVFFEYDELQGVKYRQALRDNKVKLGPPTVLRPVDRTPAARPVMHTYRAQVGDLVLTVQAQTLIGAMNKLTNVSGEYYNRIKAADAKEIRIWKSRATSTPVKKKVASK